MTRRPLSAHQSEALRDFGRYDGDRVPGGCESCEAFQIVTPISPGVWSVTVHHDTGCPVLARNGGAAR